MVGYQVLGGNCVSVPSGCTDFTWIDTCADFLMQYATVAVIGDNDDPGHEMVERIADKLECLVLAPDWDLYGTCKDVNELLFRSGAGRVQEVIESVRPVPTLGLLNIAQVRAADLTSLPRLISGIAPIDRLTGGLYMGDLIILTGRRGEGKSTFLSQLTLEAVDQELNVCVYSGEITAERYRYLLYFPVCPSSQKRNVSHREAPVKYLRKILPSAHPVPGPAEKSLRYLPEQTKSHPPPG